MTEAELRWQLPTLEKDQAFFESYLRPGQCPSPARKSDGNCPFYFVGGRCDECDVCSIFCRAIVDAWANALDERRASLMAREINNE